MSDFDGQYSGAALHGFIRALDRSQALILQILGAHGLERIDEEAWYPLQTARSIYTMIGARIGDLNLRAVGVKMIDAARLSPEVKDVPSALSRLDATYHLHVRGPDIGHVTTTFEDDRTAVIVSSTPFPCALQRGIVQGCCSRFGERALIEHGPGGCMDQGAASCTYRVAW